MPTERFRSPETPTRLAERAFLGSLGPEKKGKPRLAERAFLGSLQRKKESHGWPNEPSWDRSVQSETGKPRFRSSWILKHSVAFLLSEFVTAHALETCDRAVIIASVRTTASSFADFLKAYKLPGRT